MDHKLQEFIELVDCRPEDVLDVPQHRRGVPPDSGAGVKTSPAARRESLGEIPIYFGKHSGKLLKDVPRSYLDWALDQKPTKPWFRKFQRQAREFLKRPDTRGRQPKGRRDFNEHRDPLTKEYLKIVKHG